MKTAINQAHYTGQLCPPKDKIFHAFYTHPLQDTKVIILGQDPYHTPGKANGLAFGYNSRYEGKIDASLRNIIHECKESAGFCGDTSLESWAKQGVLLLNTRLTTLIGQPLAHKNIGWEDVVKDFLKVLDENVRYKVYMLWGREAQTYKDILDSKYNLILETSHPSPFSANKGFMGCDHFAEANDYLECRGRGGIIW